MTTQLFIITPHYGPQEVLDRFVKSLNSLKWHDRDGHNGNFFLFDQNPPNKNRYYTWPNNEGIKRAMAKWDRQDECMIWLANDDLVVYPDTALQAEKCFAEEGWDKCGIVGTRCVKLGDPDFIVWGGSKQCYPTGDHKHGSVAAGDLNVRTEEEWVTFASVFLNARMVQDIGLLDKTLQHLCSDSDYCFRARAAGWKCYYEPKAVVEHMVGTSSFYCTDPILQQIKHEDILRFRDKWLTGGLFKSLTQYNGPEYVRR